MSLYIPRQNEIRHLPPSKNVRSDYAAASPYPEVSGNINTTDPSFELGTMVAQTFEGNLTGNVTGTVSDISNHSTTELSEGNNLYYTTARHDSDTLIQVNSAYVQSRQTSYNTSDFTDSAFVTGLPVSTFTNDANYLDSTTVAGRRDSLPLF